MFNSLTAGALGALALAAPAHALVSPVTASAGLRAVTATVKGLHPGTPPHSRVVAPTAHGTATGAERPCTTAPPVDRATGGALAPASLAPPDVSAPVLKG